MYRLTSHVFVNHSSFNDFTKTCVFGCTGYNIIGGASMYSGTVKWFNSDKGFGFIANSESGEDYFVHYSAIMTQGYKSLEEGQKVTFDIEKDPKNPSKSRAVNVFIA